MSSCEEGQETEAQNAWVLHTKPAIWNGANLVIFNGGFMPVEASRGFVFPQTTGLCPCPIRFVGDLPL